MQRLSSRTVVLLLTAFLTAACAGMPRPDAVGAAGTGPGAALARLTVQNHTTFELAIGYRRVTPPRAEIIVGRIAPKATGRTAPIPAGEPIVLVARNAAGAEYVLPLRSFAEDADWTWQIAADAAFKLPETAPGNADATEETAAGKATGEAAPDTGETTVGANGNAAGVEQKTKGGSATSEEPNSPPNTG